MEWLRLKDRAITFAGGLIKRWDTAIGKCLHTYSGYQQSKFNSIAISPDGKCLLSGDDENIFKCWDTSTGNCLHTYSGYQQSKFTFIAISPDGDWFVITSADNKIKRINTFTGKCIQIYSGHQDVIEAVAISSDGDWFVSCSCDRTTKRWDTLTGECLYTYTGCLEESVTTIESSDLAPEDYQSYVGHKGSVYAVAISPNGDWFVSGYKDKKLQCWNTFTGECVQKYTGHQSVVTGVVISFDSRYIISLAGDEIKIWNMATGECIRTISNKPCAGMRIGGALGLTSGQIESLKALGAVDD